MKTVAGRSRGVNKLAFSDLADYYAVLIGNGFLTNANDCSHLSLETGRQDIALVTPTTHLRLTKNN
jgi:N-acetylmuramoyl-L-alanine amidase